MAKFDNEVKARLDELVSRYPTKAAALLPALWVAQEVYGGWLPTEAMAEVAEHLGVAPAEVQGVASFYTMYNKEPVGRHHIEICHNVSCMVFGADDMVHHCEKKLDIANGETTPDGLFTLNRVECLGACCNPVAIQVGGKYYENMNISKLDTLLEDLRASHVVSETVHPPQSAMPEQAQF